MADITTTGSTLRDNHLRVLDDGVILRSQATLFAAPAPERAAGAGATAEAGGRWLAGVVSGARHRTLDDCSDVMASSADCDGA